MSPDLRSGASRYRTLISAFGSRALVLPVTGVASLLTSYIVISGLGSVEYALLSLIVSVALLLPFGDLGLGSAIINVMATSDQKSRMSSDDPVFRTVLSALRVTSVVALCALFIVVSITLANLWPPILGVDSSKAPYSSLNWTAGLCFGVLCLLIPSSLGQRILIGSGRTASALLMQIVGPVVTLALTTVAVYALGSVWLAAVAVPLSLTSVALCQTVVAVRHTKLEWRTLLAQTWRPRRHVGSRLRGSAGPMLLITVSLPFALQADRIILSHVSSVDAVARYSLAFQLYSPVWSVFASAGVALWPLFAAGQHPSREALGASPISLARTTVGFFLAAAMSAALLVLVGGAFSRLVSGGAVLPGMAIFASFGILLVVQVVQLPFGMYFTSEPGLRFQSVCVIIMVPINVVLSILLAVRLGAVGPILGSAFCIALIQLVPAVLRARSERKYGLMESELG